MRRWFFILAAFLFVVPELRAHEMRPAYLEIRQTGEQSWDMLWKVPGRGPNERLALYVRLPDDCKILKQVQTTYVRSAFVERSAFERPGGLAGAEIRIEGLERTLTDALARIERSDGTTQVARITPTSPSFVVEDSPSWWQVAWTYLVLGVEHILLGIDHLLFVLALLLLVKGWKRLVATITAFTVAHSLTLAAATLGLVHAPQRPVEAIIALSIVFVATEIIHIRQGRPSLTERRPWLIAFSFGLLHGFGFAGALTEIGLPEQSIPLALLFFNVGVEVGQLLFIAAMLLLGALVSFAGSRARLQIPEAAWQGAAAYVIGGLAAYWTIERVVGML